MKKPKSVPPQSSSIRAFVDQVNEGMATLLLGEDESVKVDMPLAWLPAGVAEGLVLRFAVSIASPQATQEIGRAHV